MNFSNAGDPLSNGLSRKSPLEQMIEYELESLEKKIISLEKRVAELEKEIQRRFINE